MLFYDALASLIHDMKNSLVMVINRLDEVVDELPAEHSETPKLTSIQQEAKRLNNNLIDLLTMYRMENERISPIIDEVDMSDFLQDCIAENTSTATASGVQLVYTSEDDIEGYFDETLVRGIVNNLIGNALRYTNDRIEIYACEEDGYLKISVEDNGDGFPKSMLQAQDADTTTAGIGDGRTLLGIHFSSLVAEMHTNNDRKGFIKLENQVNLEGGCFSIYLP